MRKTININHSWYFLKDCKNVPNSSKGMKRIHLPHTWNDKDGQDGGNDYFRGRCAYFKKLGKIDPQGQDRLRQGSCL